MKRLHLSVSTIFLLAFFSSGTQAQWIPSNPVTKFEKQPDGVLFTVQNGTLKLQVCTDSIIRAIYAPSWPPPDKPDYVVIKNKWAPVEWTMESTGKDVTLSTSRLKVTVDRQEGLVSYTGADGQNLLTEGPKQLVPAVVNNEHTYHADDVLKIYGSEEAFYGLGQHQAGVWNYRGESVDHSQDNTNISVPMFLSSKGYGIFWNNTSASRFNNRFIHYLFLSSDVADKIDYYFLYGPDFDRIIADYRELTGAAPLFGK